MNLNELLDENETNGLHLTQETRDYLRETAKWAKFIAITGFVFLGFMVIFSFTMSYFMGKFGADLEHVDMPIFRGLLSVIYLILALIFFFPVLYLYKFATNMMRALDNDDEAALTEAFKNMKSQYKFYGVYLIIIIAIYALMFIFALLGGLIGLMQ